MSPIDCNHAPPLRDWFNPPAIIDDREEIHYEYPKVKLVQDIDSVELKEWIDDFDAKQFPESVERSAAIPESTLEQRFAIEANKWSKETAHLSSPLQKMSHPSYQAIMGMAAQSQENKRAIIRLMLTDLLKNRSDWYLALSYLTGNNPIRERDYGRPSKMADAWIKWGKSQRIL